MTLPPYLAPEDKDTQILRLCAALAEAHRKNKHRREEIIDAQFLLGVDKTGESILRPIEQLKMRLAEAVRERDAALDRLCTAPGEGDLVTAATDMTANYVEANRRAERAEAALADAREVMTQALAWADDFDINDTWTDDARAFLERTKG